MINIHPKDIEPLGGIFLPGAFGKAELELAALCIYYVCLLENEWRPVCWAEVHELVTTTPSHPLHWAANPFCKPDPDGLVAKGWASAEDRDGERWFMLTEDAVQKMEHVAPAPLGVQA